VSRRRTLTPLRSGDEGWKARLQLPPRDERFRTEARGVGEARCDIAGVSRLTGRAGRT
jgi:hypothetical protein